MIVLASGLWPLASGVAAVGAEARSRGVAGLAGPIAAALAVLATATGLIVVWSDLDSMGSWLPRVMASAAVAATAFGLHAGLSAWARRPRWLRTATIAVGYATAAQAVVIIARESATNLQARVLAASAIVLVLGTVLIPVLAWAARTDAHRAGREA